MNMKHIAVAILMSDVAELATYRKSWQQITPKMGQDGAKMAILAPPGKPGLTRRPQDPANLALLGMLLATTLPNKLPRWRQDNQLVKFMAPSGRKLPPTWYWVGPSWHFLGCSLLDFAIHYLG